MWNKIINATGTLHIYIIAALILVIALMGISLTATKTALELKDSQLETATVTQRGLQADLTSVTNELLAQVEERERLKRDLELERSLNTQAAITKANIELELADQRALIQQLRTSGNENTRSWANTAVPDDVSQLLEHATYCAQRGHRQEGICITSRLPDKPVPPSRM
ncbi:hypothetical protein [Shewanella acanthi]|uniref:hypothetical protein n=1 Tax=Shewanella acanthi TaxID=2864212 RepID=UPI0021AC94D8|nr:hypothetical protein [Shewanella acanthi]